jgi:adenylosuccinate lyase
MRVNLERSAGLVFSEGVLLRLIEKGLARQKAYELVQRSALLAHEGQGRFRDLLGGDSEVSRHLTAAELDAAFDLQHHLRHVDRIIRRALQEG